MASGSRSQRSRAPARAPPAAGDAHLPPLNPEFMAMSSMQLVAYLKRHRHRTSESDLFADAGLVLAERERRLKEAEELIRKLQAENQALRAGEAAARALQHPRAANANKPRTRHGSGGTTRRTQQVVPATGEVGDVVPTKKKPYKARRMSAPLGLPPISSDDESVGDNGDTTTSAEGEVHDNVPRHRSLRMNASSGFEGRSAMQAKQPRRRS